MAKEVDVKLVENYTLRLIMPAAGDMSLAKQEGGTVELSPVFYGPEAMGPQFQVLNGDKVVGRYKIRMKTDGKLELKRAVR